ncbi:MULTISPECIES: nitrogenase component 1 [unclassified Clostridium]|uniref:nitrogenase component 1 n=1 Tax=unclassified Clostridium TaxID=2614128 RepID=UPI000297774B|nr:MULTISPECIES: nitrogenase component 1 [unclassified Clostridium]EKQ53815.1 MAG: nitrogenase molybdenum-iron protein, alpha and beta chain [Clostridium sp. Maddingley MBC34-26]
MSNFVERPRYTCALGGALSTLRAIPRAIPIIHASSGCGHNLNNATNAGSAYLGGGYCGATSLPSTNVTEKHIVFGGEERLKEQIQSTLEVMDGDLYVVVTGCMVEMIGDDVVAVVKDFGEVEKPVIVVPTPSFKGNSYYGYDLLLEGLIKQYIKPQEEKIKKQVNILGIVPGQDVFWKGNLKEIKRILGLIGIKANTLFGEGETLDDIKESAGASLNIVLSDIYGKKAAESYKETHNIPYITTQLPIGYIQTEKFVRIVGKYFNISKRVIDKALENERNIYYDYFERFLDIYTDADLQRYSIIVGDANYAPALARFVSDELGWLPELAVITDLLNDSEKNKISEQFKGFESGLEPTVKFDSNTSSVKRYLREVWEPNNNQRYYDSMTPIVVIGSVYEKDLAASINSPLVTVSYPITNRIVLNRSYIGFNGGLTLTEDILSSLVTGR